MEKINNCNTIIQEKRTRPVLQHSHSKPRKCPFSSVCLSGGWAWQVTLQCCSIIMALQQNSAEWSDSDSGATWHILWRRLQTWLVSCHDDTCSMTVLYRETIQTDQWHWLKNTVFQKEYLYHTTHKTTQCMWWSHASSMISPSSRHFCAPTAPGNPCVPAWMETKHQRCTRTKIPSRSP